METVNQPTQAKSMNVEINLDSSTIEDSPQSFDDVESQGSSENKRCVNKKYNHAQCKTRTAYNETETTNIQLPVVDKVNNNNDNKEEPMDTTSADDDIDKRRKIINDAQQVEVLVKPQSSPQQQNVEKKEHNFVTDNEDDGEKTSIEAEQCKYEEANKIKEDELLQSDNEDDKNLGLKENVTTDSESITMEQEEELLKSDDEEEEISKEKETIFKAADSDHEDTNENFRTDDNFETTTQDLEQKADNINETHFNFKIHNQVKFVNSNSERHDFKEHNEIKSCEKSFHQIDDYKHKTENMVEEYCSNDNQSSEREFLKKTRKNSENHRILYQFDLDDESSSQDSFQFNKSALAQESDDKKSNTLDDSSISQTQVYETASSPSFADFDDVKDVNKGCREEYDENESDKTENKAEIPYSPSSKVPLSDSDNETDAPNYFSTRIISANNEEDYGDNEVKQSKNPALQPPKEASLKSKGSSNDEDDYMHQDVGDVADTKEFSSKLSDSSNLTVEDNLHVINENAFYDEKYQNKTTIKYKLSVNKEMYMQNDRNSNDVNDKRDKFLPVNQNGNGDSENDSYEAEHCNDSFLRNDETSSDSNCMQYSSFNLPQNEKSQTSIHKEVYDNNIKKEIKSEIENSLKIDKNSQEYHNNEYNDITGTNKQRFSVPFPLEIRKEDDASRSSLASSNSYSSSTSSSQHLVIDHPMEDVKEEKVKPLRINLKRKLSYLSGDDDFMSPQQKQVHLHDEILEQENNHKHFLLHKENTENPPEFSGERRQLDEDIEMAENAVENYQDHKIKDLDHQNNSLLLENNKEKALPFSTESELAESSFIKSLLLQQLEKPIETPNIVTNCNVSPFAPTPATSTPTHLTVPPLPTKSEVSSLILAVPAPPPNPKETDTSVTKYLCFKCKTGSFDTLAELTEHQATCLISHNLFPFISSQPPSTSITQPINSLTNTNSLPSSKPVPLTEFTETVTHPNKM